MPIFEVDRYDLREPGEADGIYEHYDPPRAADAASSSSLDPVPKTSEKPPPRPLERDYVFRKHLEPSERVNHWLRTRCPDEALKNRVLACGTDAWIDESPSTGRFRIRCTRCGWRACPLCRVRWALGQREKISVLAAGIAPGRRKLATLTLRSSGAPLKSQVQRLWHCYRKLRQRSIWKKAVKGSIAVLEVTYNAKRDQWHPHLHCILDASYIDCRALSKQWLQLTLTSKIVDIRAIRDTLSVPKYLTKYLLKATELPADVNPEREDELYGLFRKARFIRFAGTLRLKKGEEIWRPPYPTDWSPFRVLEAVLVAAAAGDMRAMAVLDAVAAERIFAQANPFPDPDG